MALFKNRSRKTVTLIVAGGLTLAGTGVAFAYWTSSGEGEGAATTGASTGFVVTSLASEDDPLTPGGPGQTIPFTVHNPSAGNQQLTSMSVSVANADGTEWVLVDGCSAADYTVTITTPNPFVATVLTPNSATVTTDDFTGVATILMTNLPTNQDACQNADVPLYFLAGTLPV